MAKTRRTVRVGKANLNPGEKRIVEVNGRSIGVFNVGGDYFALNNRCPHMGGALCEGPVTGTTLPTDQIEFNYGRRDELVRCGWHGWEFEIKTGRCTVDPRMRAKSYQITVESDELILHL
ncbi:MAG: Rieske (2Fe-2S) protein [Chloroflexota bacterium]